MPKYRRSIGVVVSDIHSWFKLGLLNPETRITDEKGNVVLKPTATVSQEFLWQVYTWGLDEVKALQGNDPCDVFLTGDLIHGNKHLSEQMSTRPADQITAARDNIRPLYKLKKVRRVRFASSTDAHSFGEQSSDILLADYMRIEFPTIDTKVVDHGLITLDGVKIDYAHHGPGPGSRNWSIGNEARNYLKSLMMGDLDCGQKPPDLVLRGHYHTYVREWAGVYRNGKQHQAWMVTMPSLCLLSFYGHQATKSTYRIAPGIVAFEIINGRIHDIYPFIRTIDIRTIEDE